MIGNGRIHVTGRLASNAESVQEILWRVGNYPWTQGVGALGPGDRFSFTVHGDDLAPWERFPGHEPPYLDDLTSEIPNGGWSASGSHFIYALPVAPKRLWARDPSTLALVYPVADAATVDTTPSSWAWVNGVLHYKPAAAVAPTDIYVSYDPVFSQGQGYTLDLKVIEAVTLDEIVQTTTFSWDYEVVNLPSQMLAVTVPEWLAQGPAARGIFKAIGMMIADMRVGIEDMVAQTFVRKATWALPLWEEMIGLPANPNVPLDERRAYVLNRLGRRGGSRSGFFAALDEVAGVSSIVDTYDQYRIDLRLGVTDVEARKRAEEVIKDLKPVGINVVVNYPQFIAGVSLAGDSL